MNLDGWLEDQRRREASDARIEARGPECLAFAAIRELADSEREPGRDDAAHLESCPRCASLVEAMRRRVSQAEDEIAATSDARSSDGQRPFETRRLLAGLATRIAVAAAVVALAFVLRGSEDRRSIGPGPAADVAGAGEISLGDLYEEGVEGGLLADLLTRSVADADATFGERRELPGGVVVETVGIRGPRFFGFCNPTPSPGFGCPETDCLGRLCEDGSPCDDPVAMPACRESRLTLEMYVPADFAAGRASAEPPAVVVMQIEDPDAGSDSACGQKRGIVESLARAGTPGVVWYERDTLPYPADATPMPRLCRQFGFESDADLQLAGYRWMMLGDPDALTPAELRYDLRFAHAQAFVLATTFFESYAREHVGAATAAPEDWSAWLDDLRVCLAGDSMERCDNGVSGEGGVDEGCLTAAGIDPRVAAVLVGGASGLTDGPGNAYQRYESDWSLCPGTAMDCGVRSDPASVDPWKDFSSWAWRHRGADASYFNVYAPARDRDRYDDLWILAVVATHDWRMPLGSHASDAWVGEASSASSEPDPWRVRHLLRINRDRGVGIPVGFEGDRVVTAGELLLRRAVAQVRGGEEALPSLRIESLDTTDRRRWHAMVRIGDRSHETAPEREHYTAYVAFSDDRDFRRCGAPILCSSTGGPCLGARACLEPDYDDNKDEEDLFLAIPIPVERVAVAGEYRSIEFDPPEELAAFATAPLIAFTIEVRIEGDDPESCLDDMILHTPITFENEASYPAFECPE